MRDIVAELKELRLQGMVGARNDLAEQDEATSYFPMHSDN